MTQYAFRRPWMRAAAGAFDAAGSAFFRAASKRPHLPPQNLLIVRLDHLGDVWNITGLPKAVKEHISGCRVTCLVSSAAAPLLEANPFVDEIIRFDAPWFWKKRNDPARAKIASELSRRRFDAALSIRGDVREHWLVYRAGIPRRIGPGITGGGFLMTDRVAWSDDRHELERIAAVAEPLGLPRKIWTPEIHFALGERERLLAESRVKGLRPGAMNIGFQIEAGTTAKTWPAEHSARFLSRLLERKPEAIAALLGANGVHAQKIIDGIEPAFQERVLNLCGRMPLRELAAAVGRFSLIVAPDSGPGHLLAWLGAPVLFLYSGVNRFESWKPLAERASALRQEVPCSPCHRRVCPVPGHPCMEGIDPDRALAAALERLT